MENIKQKITDAVMNDMDFYKDFISAPDASALQKVLQARGFEFTVDQIEDLFSDGVDTILDYTQSEELNEDQLDDVAGGGFFKGTARLVVSFGVGFGYGALCGICPGAAAGAPYVAGGLAAWTTAGYMSKNKKKKK